VRRLLVAVGGVAVLLAAGCGGEGTVKPLPETVVGKTPTARPVAGNAAAGKQVFVSTGCGGCHTFKAAGTNGKIGPDLDKYLKGKPPAFVRESIVNPNAVIAKGYNPNIMPGTYGSDLSAKQLADLVAFITQK
jgi:mono/diheme cytochrome c family protein